MTVKSKEDSATNVSCNSVDQNFVKNDEQHLYDFTNTMLKGRLFIGNFQEKRYVASLQEYRDVIVVNPDEKELLVDLEVLKKRLSSSLRDKWIGITTPKTIGAPAGHCVWVDLAEEVFGTFWYKIRAVRFRENEVSLKIKPLKAVSLNTSSEENTVKTPRKNVSNASTHLESDVSTKTDRFRSVKQFFSDVFTWENVKETTKFLLLLTGTVFLGLVGGARYFAEFTLKLTRELSNLIKVLTPFAIACVRFFEKVVGGFYILLAMIFRDLRGARPVVNVGQARPMLTYNNYGPYGNVRRIKYGQPVRVTEM